MVANGEGLQDLIDKTQKLKANVEDTNKTVDMLKQRTQKFAGSLGIASQFSETMAGGLVKSAEQVYRMVQRGENMSEIFGKTVGHVFNLANIAGSALDIIINSVIEVDKMAKGFQRATGFSGDFSTEVQGAYNNLAATGASAGDVSKALEAMASNMSTFNKNTKEANLTLVEHVTILSLMGVSAADTAKSIDDLQRAFGMGQDQAKAFNLQIVSMGDAIDMTAQQMSSNWKAVAGDIAVYGDRQMEVFQRLSATVKATGIEMSTLMAVGKKFNTFKDAASNAASMNAVLGTSISALNMIGMTEEQRVQEMRRQISSAVGDFDNLNRHTQEYIAQQMGLKDVAEARKLVNMSESEYLDNIAKQQESNKTQEQMAQLMKDTVPALQQFKLAFMELVFAMKPVINFFTWLLKGLAEYKHVVLGAVGAMVIMRTAMKLHAFWQGAVLAGSKLQIASKGNEILANKLSIASLGSMTFAQKVSAFWTNTLAAAQTRLGMATAFTNKKMLIYAAIFVALAAILSYVINPPLVAAFAFMAIGVFLLGKAFNSIQGPAIIGGLIIMGVAAALGLMFMGLSMVMDSMTGFIQLMIANIAVLPALGAAFYVMGGGLYFMAAAGVVAAYGLGAAAIALAGIMAIMKLGGMSFGDLAAAGESVANMGEGVQNLASGLGQMRSMAADIGAIGSKGFLAVRSDAGATSMVMGSDEVMKNFIDGKLTVDVKIPEIKLPEIILNVTVTGDKVDVKKSIGKA